jgi:hypothetical protein
MRTCPFCGTENEPFFRFCLGCGEDLDKVFPPDKPAAAPAPAASPRREPSREIAAVRSEPQRPAPAAAGVGSPPLSRTNLRRPSTGLVIDPPPVVAPASELEVDLVVELPPDQSTVKSRAMPPAPAAARAPAAQPPSRRVRRRVATAALIQVFDNGSEELIADLAVAPLVIGRSEADYDPSEGPWDAIAGLLPFPDDDFMAPRHVGLFIDFDGVMVEPQPSTNSIFMQLTEPHPCNGRTLFRIGQQLLQFDRIDDLVRRGQARGTDNGLLGSPVPESAWGRLAQLITPTQFGEVHLLGGDQVRLGRERGDINFPSDLFVSGLHAALRWRDGGVVLEDLGSSNGTYVQLTEPTRITTTTLILVGQQLFRIEISHS